MKFPKDDSKYKWTSHIKSKMVYYRISAQMIKNILRLYTRKEEGIALNTLAVMKRRDTKKRKEEMWVMFQKMSKVKSQMSKVILISAWRYPGISKPGKKIPIPDEILQEIQEKWF